MNVSLVSSLHLNHGALPLDCRAGDSLPMQSFVPVGLLCLKAAADQARLQANIRVTEVNGLINEGPPLAPWRCQEPVRSGDHTAIRNDKRFYDRLVDAILRVDDSLVGFMTDADSLHHTVTLAKQVKQRSPQTLVSLGGPAASPISRLLLERFPFLDFVVRGEGELTFVELLRAVEQGRKPSDVLGLSWREGDAVIQNAERGVVDDLDTLPVPAFDAYEMSSGAPLYLDVGRGCPFKCQFCATAPFWNRKYRMKSIERIVEELALIRDVHGRKHVNFSHDIFTCDRDWTFRFCERLAKSDLSMTWTCSTRTDIVDHAVLEALAVAGCVEIYYGIESGSGRIQREINKNLDMQWAREVVAATVAVGIRPITGFIVGYPTETSGSLQETLTRFFEFLEIGGARAHLFTLCPFHESPLYRQYQKTVERPAQYFELPLHPSPSAIATSLREQHRDVFASTFRYATPHVDRRLIDASEEISAQLVVLKSLWPHLLPYYASALEWYERWVSWIEAENQRRRPGTRLCHQGDAGDLLRFVDQELKRLGLEDSGVAELARYEHMILCARTLPAGSAENRKNTPCHLSDASVVVSRRDFLAERFRYDLRSLLAGKSPTRPLTNNCTWIVVAKTTGDVIDAIQIEPEAKRILDAADRPRRLGDLIVEACADERDGYQRWQSGVALAKGLIEQGLMSEVRT